MNNRNFLFLSLFSLFTISCSEMEIRESITPLNRYDFKAVTTSALEITQKLHGLLKNKTTENIDGFIKKLITTTGNIQAVLTAASIYEQDPTRAAKLAISPEQEITTTVLTDYEEAILEIRLILLHPNSSESTTNTSISIDRLKTYQENAQNYVNNNPNLDDTLRNDFELYIKDTERLLALKEKLEAETHLLIQKIKSIIEVKTDNVYDQALGVVSDKIKTLSNKDMKNYMENVICLANNLNKINNASFSQLQDSEQFLRNLRVYNVTVMVAADTTGISREIQKQFVQASNRITQHCTSQKQQAQTTKKETPEAKTKRIQAIIKQNDNDMDNVWNTWWTGEENTKQPSSSFGKAPCIVGGLTFIVILAILYKYNKLSIIMEKISNLILSHFSVILYIIKHT